VGFLFEYACEISCNQSMRLRVTALILIALCWPALSQESSQQITADFERSKVLAVKLYPECSDPNGALTQAITRLDLAAKVNNLPLFNYPGKPLVYAIGAAASLGMQPIWSRVTKDERDEIFKITADGLANTRDLAVAETPPTTPARDSFNPGSMNPESPTDKVADREVQNSPAPQPPFNPGSLNSEAPAIAPSQQSLPTAGSDGQSMIAGFHCYLYSLEAQSSGLRPHMINSHSSNLEYSGGPLGGMNKAQATEYAIRMWQQMSPDDQSAFVSQARSSGDPIAQQQADSAAAAARRPTGATIYNSDGTVSQVQYH
jgi:hypothetical protein